MQDIEDAQAATEGIENFSFSKTYDSGESITRSARVARLPNGAAVVFMEGPDGTEGTTRITPLKAARLDDKQLVQDVYGDPDITVSSPTEVAPAETVTLDAVTEDTPASSLPVNPATGLKPPGKRGRKPVVRTPEEQAAADAQRKDRQKVGKDAIRNADKGLKVVEKPFNIDDYATEDAARAAALELQAERDIALTNAFRIIADRNIGPTSKAKQVAKQTI
jgi:hypothetical protein